MVFVSDLILGAKQYLKYGGLSSSEPALAFLQMFLHQWEHLRPLIFCLSQPRELGVGEHLSARCAARRAARVDR